MRSCGWVGKILRVDLTEGEITEESTTKYAPKFIGGRAMGAKIYWDEVPPEVGALDPENKLIVMTGPVTGTLAPSANRVSVIAKSPVTTPECFMYSNVGGHWGAELKFAGYDGLIIQGKALKPVYLWISDGKAEILDAYRLWGTTTRVAQNEIWRLHGQKTRVMVIGPAGENLCREAVIASGHASATGIGGFGAVMASKNLKAVAVRGTGVVGVAKPRELTEMYSRFAHLITQKRGEPGPQHYWRSIQSFTGTSPMAVPFIDDSAVGEEIAKGNAVRHWGGCFACPVSCIQSYQFKDGLSGGGQCNDVFAVEEDEWLYHGGKRLGKDNIEFSVLCQELGLSITQVMGHLFPRQRGSHHSTWARLLVDAGIWNNENTGLPVDKFGSSEFFREYLHKVAYRQDIGDALAEGQVEYLRGLMQRAETDELRDKARRIYEEVTQKNEPSYSENCWLIPPAAAKGTGDWLWLLEMSTNVRRDKMASNVISTRHLAWLTPEQQKQVAETVKKIGLERFGSEKALDMSTPEGKVPLVTYVQHIGVETDSVPSCRIARPDCLFSQHTSNLRGDTTYDAQVFSAVTGIDMTEAEMLKFVGERGANMERAILVREGRRREHDLSWNHFCLELFKPWLDKDTLLQVMDEYYRARGWNVVTGIPTRARLEELDLKDVADELASGASS